jgi:hypothetical protein
MKKLTCLLLPFLLLASTPKKHFDLPVKYPAQFIFKFSPEETQFIINSLQTSDSKAKDVKTVTDDIMEQINAQEIKDTSTSKAIKH